MIFASGPMRSPKRKIISPSGRYANTSTIADTSTAPTDATNTPCSNASAPSAVSSTNATRSVKRSAITIGAVRAIDTPRDSYKSSDLKTSPTFPGVTLMTNPERKTSELSPSGTTTSMHRR
jgi:hypothetical protein